jgi:dipeptidyl aminopeptidase/acylaminoacyl peptidase
MPLLSIPLRTSRLLLLLLGGVLLAHGATRRRFTLADDIGLTYFGDPFLGKADAITFSPDNRYFVVHTERGRLDIDRPESSLRIYRVADVLRFVNAGERTGAPGPVWQFSRSSCPQGPVITTLRWLPDSSGFGFLAASPSGIIQLFLADLRTHAIRLLSSTGQSVTSFDIRDARHYVYTALSPVIEERVRADQLAVSVVGTGRSLTSLLSPATAAQWHDRSDLWAVMGGTRRRIRDASGHPLAIHWRGQLALALSPDGHTLLSALIVPSVPATWSTLYPPPFPSDPQHIEPGGQNPNALDGWWDVSRYALIDLRTGAVHALPLGPLGFEADWMGLPHTAWSADGKAVAVTNTFFDRAGQAGASFPARPCAMVIRVGEHRAECVEPVRGNLPNGEHEPGYHIEEGIRFIGSGDDRVAVQYDSPAAQALYIRSPSGVWHSSGFVDASSGRGILVSVRQGLNDPPVLVAADRVTRQSRQLWDPNPSLRNIDLGEASVYRWKDSAGREEVGGLYKPPGYVAGRRYPLVIQTHGFYPDQFIPSGLYNTAFAARELAAAGMLVLQVRGCPVRHTPEEGPCQVLAYDSAVQQLAAEGLVDPRHVGIVGFSRTCYYTLEAITTGKTHFAAASITSGMDMSYLQYMLSETLYAPNMDAAIGAQPFGKGLETWLARSPGFNLDKVTTPLLVVGVGEGDILSEWEPYSSLLHQNKPTDLLLLKEGTHPLSNPAQRVASQGSTVDWMRFWLLGEEDSDPARKEQYARWRHLRSLQEAEDHARAAAPGAPSPDTSPPTLRP